MVRYVDVESVRDAEGGEESEAENALRSLEELEDICGIWTHACDGEGTQVKFAFDGWSSVTSQVKPDKCPPAAMEMPASNPNSNSTFVN